MSINLKELLSKENITNLYKLVLSKDSNIKNKSEKEKTLELLMVTMKKTYKSLEKNKINENNFSSIKSQYNNICVTETLNNNKKKNNIKLQERPTTQSRHIDDSLQNNRLENLFDNNFSNNDSLNNFESFDNFPQDNNSYLERPKMMTGTDINNDISIQDRLSQLENSRKSLNPKSVHNDIPDFLKPTKVGKSTNEIPSSIPTSNNNQQNLNNNESNTLEGILSGNDDMGNFSSIENLQTDTSKFNDNISLQDRLDQLEKERSRSNNPLPQQELPNNMPPVQNNMPLVQNNMEIINLQNNFTQIQEEINFLKKEILQLKSNNYDNQPKNNYSNHVVKRELQLEIDKKESKYSYKFNNIGNIIGIKLLSYSLPQPIYNINKTVIKYVFDDSINKYDKEIVISEGYYNINQLLDRLNNNENIVFSLNTQRKLNINLKIPELKNNSELIPNKKFKLFENELLQKLGFRIFDDSFKSFINAEYNFDLRLPNKIFMYILNLEQERPFGILNFNGSSSCHLNFRKPIEIDKLELLFLDENKNLYNFNNLNYNLSFKITILENSNENLSY